MKTKKPMKNFESDFSRILKIQCEKVGVLSWKELGEKTGVGSAHKFNDFLSGNQCMTPQELEKIFEVLQIPTELFDVCVEPVIKYKVKKGGAMKAKTDITYCVSKECKNKCIRHIDNWEFEDKCPYSLMSKCEREMFE